jgi:hypothetical protein
MPRRFWNTTALSVRTTTDKLYPMHRGLLGSLLLLLWGCGQKTPRLDAGTDLAAPQGPNAGVSLDASSYEGDAGDAVIGVPGTGYAGYEVVAGAPPACRSTPISFAQPRFSEVRLDTEIGAPYFTASVAVGRIDSDAVVDIAVQSTTGTGDLVTGYRLSVFIGRDRFSTVKGPFVVGGPQVALGDANADGLLDVVNWSLVSIAAPDGALAEPVRVGEFNGLRAWADLNRDNRLDTIYGRPSGDLEASLAIGPLAFDPPLRTPVDVSTLVKPLLVDVDGDQNVDLVGVQRTGPPDEVHDSLITVLYGDGAGRFSAPEQGFTASRFVGSLASGDFNCDGRADLAILGDTKTVTLLLRGPDSWLPPVDVVVGQHVADREASLPGQLAGDVGDVNGDGAHDLVITSVHFTSTGEQRGHVEVLLGTGTGAFQDPIYLESQIDGATWQFVTSDDVNGDGWDDILAALGPPGQRSQVAVWASEAR